MRIARLKSSRKAQLLSAVAVVALAGAVSGIAAAAHSTMSVGRAAPTAFIPDPIPAAILDSSVPVPISSSVISETNGWVVSNGYNLVAVYAGSAADDPTQGRIAIVRQDLRAGKQTVRIIDAGATGPLTIAANAPAGVAVETTALTGGIPLTTNRGTQLKLNLASNTISPN